MLGKKKRSGKTRPRSASDSGLGGQGGVAANGDAASAGRPRAGSLGEPTRPVGDAQQPAGTTRPRASSIGAPGRPTTAPAPSRPGSVGAPAGQTGGATRPRAGSVNAPSPVRATPASRPASGVVNPNAPAQPNRQRREATLRLVLGDEASNALLFRLSNLAVPNLPSLASKPGIAELLSNTLKTDADEQGLAQFLPEIAATRAANFSAQQLSYLYGRRADLSSRPGLKSFLIDTLANGDDQAALSPFLQEIDGTAATRFSAQQLGYLYARRADLAGRAGLKDFLIDTLDKGADEAALTPFLQEIDGTAATRFSAQHLGYLYGRRADLAGRAGLKEFAISTLATQGDAQELDRFIGDIAGTPAVGLGAQHLDYLYSLRADLGKPALAQETQAPATKPSPQNTAPQFRAMTVKELAIARLGGQELGPARADIEALRSFGYNERLYQFAAQQSEAIGKRAYQADLAPLKTAEQQAIADAEQQIKDNGPQPPAGAEPQVSGSGKARRQAESAQKQWQQQKQTYDTFIKNTLPGQLAPERQRIQQEYSRRRADLATAEQRGDYSTPELARYRQFVADNGFHPDVEWALAAAKGNLSKAQILFDACKDNAQLQAFGAWVAQQQIEHSRLRQMLGQARNLNLDANKAQIVVPYLLDCTEQATINWLTAHAPATSVDNLAIDVELLRQHKPATHQLLIQAIGLIQDKKTLSQYNTYLRHAEVGRELLALIRNRTAPAPQNQNTDTPAVMQFFQAHAAKLDDLGRFLKAANPLPAGYTTLAGLCALVTPPGVKPAIDIGDITWAIDEAKAHAQGKEYIEHIVKRLKEGVEKAGIKDHSMGYKEWLLVSGKPWTNVSADNKGFGPNAMTGIFTLTIDGVGIEVHNHFYKNGGQQYSLHLKHGKGSFDRGPELTPAKDKSVYQIISQRCLNAYTTWVNGRWAVYTLPN